MKEMFLSQSLSSLFPPSLIHPLPLLRVISQAVLKWPPAIFPNPSYMLFGAVSSKPHLHSPKQWGDHCAVTASIDFLWEVEKFCLMARHLKGPLLEVGVLSSQGLRWRKTLLSISTPALSFSLNHVLHVSVRLLKPSFLDRIQSTEYAVIHVM